MGALLNDDGSISDRTLAMAVLFDQCPDGRTEAAVTMLAECPPELGFSFPSNAGWRLWALGKGGRPDAILKDLRGRWTDMSSVLLNNTMQETWSVSPDSVDEWSHCSVAPLYVMFMNIAGIRPLTPGFKQVEIRPQLADLEEVELTAYTVQGPLHFDARGKLGGRTIRITMPAGCDGQLVLRQEEHVHLSPLAGLNPPGHLRYRLPPAATTTVRLQFS